MQKNIDSISQRSENLQPTNIQVAKQFLANTAANPNIIAPVTEKVLPPVRSNDIEELLNEDPQTTDAFFKNLTETGNIPNSEKPVIAQPDVSTSATDLKPTVQIQTSTPPIAVEHIDIQSSQTQASDLTTANPEITPAPFVANTELIEPTHTKTPVPKAAEKPASVLFTSQIVAQRPSPLSTPQRIVTDQTSLLASVQSTRQQIAKQYDDRAAELIKKAIQTQQKLTEELDEIAETSRAQTKALEVQTNSIEANPLPLTSNSPALPTPTIKSGFDIYNPDATIITPFALALGAIAGYIASENHVLKRFFKFIKKIKQELSELNQVLDDIDANDIQNDQLRGGANQTIASNTIAGGEDKKTNFNLNTNFLNERKGWRGLVNKTKKFKNEVTKKGSSLISSETSNITSFDIGQAWKYRKPFGKKGRLPSQHKFIPITRPESANPIAPNTAPTAEVVPDSIQISARTIIQDPTFVPPTRLTAVLEPAEPEILEVDTPTLLQNYSEKIKAFLTLNKHKYSNNIVTKSNKNLFDSYTICRAQLEQKIASYNNENCTYTKLLTLFLSSTNPMLVIKDYSQYPAGEELKNLLDIIDGNLKDIRKLILHNTDINLIQTCCEFLDLQDEKPVWFAKYNAIIYLFRLTIGSDIDASNQKYRYENFILLMKRDPQAAFDTYLSFSDSVAILPKINEILKCDTVEELDELKESYDLNDLADLNFEYEGDISEGELTGEDLPTQNALNPTEQVQQDLNDAYANLFEIATPILFELTSNYQSFLAEKALSTNSKSMVINPQLLEFVKKVKEMVKNDQISKDFTNQWIRSIQNGEYLLDNPNSLKLIEAATRAYTSNLQIPTGNTPNFSPTLYQITSAPAIR